MSKILAIDYGTKRSGLAVTDDLKIIASGLAGIFTADIFTFLKDYFSKNDVDTIVIGLPTKLNGEISEIETDIQKFISKLKIEFPDKKLDRMDERFTSKIAAHAISQSGKNKKKRENKHLLDEVSATIILQSYLEKI